ncbi:carboxypeptidase-like regulatory domain-containing protein [Mucilaginibacter sp.]|uniref:carboxypeptidase-like regulatory domain-containing protein n=1 Tax=Mucilaginibacter sp. TaxID=1882438 RepID=UPI0026257669|nr:carboxypeptidase-like regulatory domain-containing protein [Mucilaginibacter sp.]MDB5126599.1 CarboxypepD reg-like protein [Mucilaginibacter sp.]
MKRILFVALFLIPSLFANAQIFEGLVKDAKTNLPLPYVNVGIIGKSVGTVTDSAGRYKLNLANHDTDSLKLSMIGYKALTYQVANFLKNANTHKTLLLQPAVTQLKEVKVNNHKWKEVILGNTTQSKSSNAGFRDNRLGYEIGSIIKIKKSPIYIKQFNTAIASEITDSVKLRLNFYSVKDGMPDQLLQNQNIFVTVKKGQQNLNVNLEPYNIYVDDKFFVSLEWIQNAKGHGVMFSANLSLFGGGSIISRDTSQDKWEKVSIAGIGFNVLAEY